ASAIREIRKSIAVKMTNRVVADSRASSNHQLADVAVVDATQLLGFGACGAHFGEMPQAGEPSPEQRAGASRLARQGESDRFHDAEHERDGQDPHQPEAGVGLEEEPEPALGLRANVDFVTAPAARAPGFGDGRAPMTNASVRRDDHARAR